MTLAKALGRSPWFNFSASEDGQDGEIDIFGPIGFTDWDGNGATYPQFLDELRGLKGAKNILVNLQSDGGLVTEGLAIYNALAFSNARVVARVQGLAASMASVIAMAADEIQMPENAYLMIHEISGFAGGTADDLERTAGEMRAMQGMIAGIYAQRSEIATPDILEMMKNTTWLNGKDAVAKGFADTLLAPSTATGRLGGADLLFTGKNMSEKARAALPEPLKAWFRFDKPKASNSRPENSDMKPDEIKKLIQEETSGLTNQLTELGKQHGKLTEDLATANKNLADTNKALTDANAKIGTLETKNTALETKNQELEQKITSGLVPAAAGGVQGGVPNAGEKPKNDAAALGLTGRHATAHALQDKFAALQNTGTTA